MIPLNRTEDQDKIAYIRLTSLINNMADGVIAVDEQIKIVLFNGAALNILDRNNLKIGDSLREILKPIDKNNQPVDVEELVRSISLPTTNRDLRLVYTDGSISNLYLSIAPVKLGYGSTGQKGYVLLLRDITTEKSLEEERDEFISVVSHELRTPITIAEGNISNAQLILEREKGVGDLTQIKQALIQAHNQILYLSDMINDLATLSRAERGKLTLEVEPINMHDLLIELSRNYRPEATKRGLEIKTELDPNLEILRSSKLYVREILQNFITNALKYTVKGYVNISANQKNDGVEVSISDTGIGISKADQERIFDKFYRADDARTRNAHGTGLGLYVTMKLARLTNATIDFKSELNKGSTFSVHFPNIGEIPKTVQSAS
jgi:two-component system phosphate regulon sensor histidine kinase PhoR